MAEPTVERWCSAAFLPSEPDAAKALVSMVAGTSAAGYAGCVHALLGLDYRERLGEIRVPTLFVAGGQDAGVPSEAMREMHRAVRGSQFVELAHAGHISNIECSAEFNGAVGEFLSAGSG